MGYALRVLLKVSVRTAQYTLHLGYNQTANVRIT